MHLTTSVILRTRPLPSERSDGRRNTRVPGQRQIGKVAAQVLRLRARREQSKILVMSRVEELESQIMGLLPEEFRELRVWVAEHDAEVWDRQFDNDVRAGKLDAIADQALRDFSENRASDL